MPTEYTLQELAHLTDVTPRTIRYYITQGLLPSPSAGGPQARYSDSHLERLRLIKKLQAAHLPLAEIRSRLSGMNEAQIATIADEPGFPPQMSSATDYIRGVLSGASHLRRATQPEPPPMPSLSAPMQSPPGTEPDRAQWERISLAPDIELHIRRPLARPTQKRVDRLITIARQLLEED